MRLYPNFGCFLVLPGLLGPCQFLPVGYEDPEILGKYLLLQKAVK
jgi:hypothetical protein